MMSWIPNDHSLMNHNSRNNTTANSRYHYDDVVATGGNGVHRHSNAYDQHQQSGHLMNHTNQRQQQVGHGSEPWNSSTSGIVTQHNRSPSSYRQHNIPPGIQPGDHSSIHQASFINNNNNNSIHHQPPPQQQYQQQTSTGYRQGHQVIDQRHNINTTTGIDMNEQPNIRKRSVETTASAARNGEPWRLSPQEELNIMGTVEMRRYKPYLLEINSQSACIEYWSNRIIKDVLEDLNTCEGRIMELFLTFVEVFDDAERHRSITWLETPPPHVIYHFVTAVRVSLIFIMNDIHHKLNNRVKEDFQRNLRINGVRQSPDLIVFTAWQTGTFDHFLLPVFSLIKESVREDYGATRNIRQILVSLPSASQTKAAHEKLLLANGRSLTGADRLPAPPEIIKDLPQLWEAHLNVPEGTRPKLEAAKSLIQYYEKVITLLSERFFTSRDDRRMLNDLFEYCPDRDYPTVYEDFLQRRGRTWGDSLDNIQGGSQNSDSHAEGMKMQTTLNNSLARLIPMCRSIAGNVSDKGMDVVMSQRLQNIDAPPGGRVTTEKIEEIKRYGLNSSVKFGKVYNLIREKGIDLFTMTDTEIYDILTKSSEFIGDNKDIVQTSVIEAIMAISEEINFLTSCWTYASFVQELNVHARNSGGSTTVPSTIEDYYTSGTLS